jgi:O-6-methylguanine DNA methyltransferase
MQYTIITLSRKDFEQHLKNSRRYYSFYETAAGTLEILSTDLAIYQAFFIDQVDPQRYQHYVFKETVDASKIVLTGTDFQIKVLKTLASTPVHTTLSYQELATLIGKPRGHRAVGTALANNRVAYFIPCHRVLRSDGNLGGYRWGIERKKILLLQIQKP